ncbi:MAG: DUF4405 domain-containing protein [Chloroflexi bacterium]|nr:DUF4405 domain-containing protein [Chloroflexota bacterium]
MTQGASTAQRVRKRPLFRWRAFVALILFWHALILSLSGVVLYIAPVGRVAHAIEWRFLWLDKEQWEAVHTILGFSFLVIVFFHIKYNWRSLLAYLKDRVRKVYTLQRELVVATALTLLLLVISVYNLPPAQQILDLSETFDAFWEAWGTQAGYHVVTEEEAHEEGETPPVRGYGRMTVRDVAEQAGIPVEVALERLRAYGVDASPDDNMLTLSGRSGFSPGELAGIIQGEPPESHGE